MRRFISIALRRGNADVVGGFQTKSGEIYGISPKGEINSNNPLKPSEAGSAIALYIDLQTASGSLYGKNLDLREGESLAIGCYNPDDGTFLPFSEIAAKEGKFHKLALPTVAIYNENLRTYGGFCQAETSPKVGLSPVLMRSLNDDEMTSGECCAPYVTEIGDKIMKIFNDYRSLEGAVALLPPKSGAFDYPTP